jgi:putative flavoprotein involved in K+ transport
VRASDIGDQERVVIVGSGNSAVDIAARLLAREMKLTLATRSEISPAVGLANEPISSLMWWLSALPTSWLPSALRCTSTVPKVDDDLQIAAADGRLRVVGEAVGLEEGALLVGRGERIPADRIIWATGFRRDLAWISALTLDDNGVPRHRRGLSTELPGLAFMGLPCMRNRRSGFLRGHSADARNIIRRLR